MIYDDEVGHGPPYRHIYTVGNYLNLGHPEFFIKGTSGTQEADMMNDLFRYVEAGNKIADGDTVRHNLGQGETCFIARSFPKEFYFDYLGWGCWFYRSLLYNEQPLLEHKFPVLQLFWPDKQGRYPWEPDCDPIVTQAQALVPVPDTNSAGNA